MKKVTFKVCVNGVDFEITTRARNRWAAERRAYEALYDKITMEVTAEEDEPATSRVGKIYNKFVLI